MCGFCSECALRDVAKDNCVYPSLLCESRNDWLLTGRQEQGETMKTFFYRILLSMLITVPAMGADFFGERLCLQVVSYWHHPETGDFQVASDSCEADDLAKAGYLENDGFFSFSVELDVIATYTGRFSPSRNLSPNLSDLNLGNQGSGTEETFYLYQTRDGLVLEGADISVPCRRLENNQLRCTSKDPFGVSFSSSVLVTIGENGSGSISFPGPWACACTKPYWTLLENR